LAVKKLDSSIYQFKGLADKAKEIIREKSRIYQKFKKENPNEDDDQ